MRCGVDIVAIERIKNALGSEKGNRFKEKVFTKGEVDYCESKTKGMYQSYAGRFAAKEAFSKALGKGLGADVNMNEIEVMNDLVGKPRLEIRGNTREVFLNLGCNEIELSISHEKEYAVAFVVII